MTAVDTLSYNEKEIRRIAVKAFDRDEEKEEGNRCRQSKRTDSLPSVEKNRGK